MTRTAIIQTAITETSSASNMPFDAWADTSETGEAATNARRLFVFKLRDIPKHDIAKAMGWDVSTVRGLRNVEPRGADRCKLDDEGRRAVVLWMAGIVCLKYGLTGAKQLKNREMGLQARQELAGRLHHQVGMSRDETMERVARLGIHITIDEWNDGFALWLPVDGVDMAAVRARADILDRRLGRGYRDMRLTHEVARLEAPYRGGVGGASSLVQLVERRAG